MTVTDHIFELMWQTLKQLKICLSYTYLLEKIQKKFDSGDKYKL